MRLLVTGGAGYLGSELVRRAPTVGWDVRSTFHTRRPELDAEWMQVDVRGAEAVARAVDGVDCVVHTAFVQHGPEAWSTTAEGAGVVARAAAGMRLLHLSSDVIFDGADDVSRYELALLLGAGTARIEAGLTTPDRCPNVSLDSSQAAALLRTRLRGVREVLA